MAAAMSPGSFDTANIGNKIKLQSSHEGMTAAIKSLAVMGGVVESGIIIA